MSLLGKRVLQNSTVTTEVIVVAGNRASNIIIKNSFGAEVIRLTVGLESQKPTMLLYDVPSESGEIEYIPYYLEADYSLDSYPCAHLQRLLGDIIYLNTGLTIGPVGMFYKDKVLGHGILEEHKVLLTETARVRIEPISLAS